jgi:hypothetical protein
LTDLIVGVVEVKGEGKREGGLDWIEWDWMGAGCGCGTGRPDALTFAFAFIVQTSRVFVYWHPRLNPHYVIRDNVATSPITIQVRTEYSTYYSQNLLSLISFRQEVQYLDIYRNTKQTNNIEEFEMEFGEPMGIDEDLWGESPPEKSPAGALAAGTKKFVRNSPTYRLVNT